MAIFVAGSSTFQLQICNPVAHSRIHRTVQMHPHLLLPSIALAWSTACTQNLSSRPQRVLFRESPTGNSCEQRHRNCPNLPLPSWKFLCILLTTISFHILRDPCQNWGSLLHSRQSTSGRDAQEVLRLLNSCYAIHGVVYPLRAVGVRSRTQSSVNKPTVLLMKQPGPETPWISAT